MIGAWGGLWHGAPYVCFALEGRIIQGFGSVEFGGERGGIGEGGSLCVGRICVVWNLFGALVGLWILMAREIWGGF